jgi:hypothetical protein
MVRIGVQIPTTCIVISTEHVVYKKPAHHVTSCESIILSHLLEAAHVVTDIYSQAILNS